MAIRSFEDKVTEDFYHSGKIKKGTPWANIKSIVSRKLDMINYAENLDDLKSPPGNKLEKLSGNLSGKHSIRINDQWRIVFRWSSNGPEDVLVCDYH